MRNRPNALELLEVAEQTLTGDLAADLSDRQRYKVALITSALGIARRELAGGPEAFPGELAELRALYGDLPGKTPEEETDALSRKLAADFRAGRFDGNDRDSERARALLKNDVLARLGEDSPRYER